MIKLKREDCTGCSACAQICPVGCIVMMRDVEGFFYPVIQDTAACVECGRCESVCPVLHVQRETRPSISAYGCRLKDRQALLGSTSGGAFYAAARHVLSAGGAVWGAAYGDKLNIIHKVAVSLEELEELRKSKYVESELGNAFQEVKGELDAGQLVLFSGTPCQIAGLKAFLGKDYENLIAIQVLCGQIVGAAVWQQYLKYQSSKYRKEITGFDFRYKKAIDKMPAKDGNSWGGWKQTHVCLVDDSVNENVVPWSVDILMWAYMERLVCRPSCTKCRFKLKGNPFAADLAIGDFWGCENNAPECYDPMGVSAVIAYSHKGKEFLEKLSDELLIQPVSVEAIWKGNPGACRAASAHPNRDDFYKELLNKKIPLDALIRKNLLVCPELLNKNYRFGLFGGYNARMAILSLCTGTKSRLAYQYSNSSLISLVSRPVSVPAEVAFPKNPFRKQMFAADLSKEFMLEDNQDIYAVDYLVIDFLEERFDLVSYENSYLTLSDALRDSSFPQESVLLRFAPETEALWQRSCLQFIRFLHRHFLPERVILIKSFLSERYMGTSDNLLLFENLEEIQAINGMLRNCYDFFESHYPVKNIVSLEDSSVLYCERDHKHGVQPCHMNETYCRAVAKDISNIVCGKPV